MLYNTVEIKPSNRSWAVTFKDTLKERKEKETKPSAIGIYHYPETLGKEKAFEVLQAHMIMWHQNLIAELTDSLKKLQKVKLSAEVK